MWQKFIVERGVPIIAKELGKTKQTVYNWLNGIGRVDDASKKRLVELSDGELSIMDFFREEPRG